MRYPDSQQLDGERAVQCRPAAPVAQFPPPVQWKGAEGPSLARSFCPSSSRLLFVAWEWADAIVAIPVAVLPHGDLTAAKDAILRGAFPLRTLLYLSRRRAEV